MNYFHSLGDRNPDISRTESSGFQSVKPIHYFRWHGWPKNNLASYDDDNVYAIFGETYARLIVEDENQADDRHLSNIVIHMGSDIYDRTKPSGKQYKGDKGFRRHYPAGRKL